jgi:hypothetical protein
MSWHPAGDAQAQIRRSFGFGCKIRNLAISPRAITSSDRF